MNIFSNYIYNISVNPPKGAFLHNYTALVNGMIKITRGCKGDELNIISSYLQHILNHTFYIGMVQVFQNICIPVANEHVTNGWRYSYHIYFEADF